jgi:phosphatidylserine/phosphatidylglycerophosphate/cardiolipin synthase-like enzyme
MVLAGPWLAIAFLCGCGAAPRAFAAGSAGAPAASTPAIPIAGYGDCEIVESAPVETSLDHPEIRNAAEVWPQMIRAAERSLDFAEFYVSTQAGSRLETVIAEIEKAAKRGVRVRFLGEKAFYKTYPETYDRLAKRKNIDVRFLNLKAPGRPGGVLHAKYFIADGEQVFLGSQNFDWRALDHIQELGVRLSGEDLASYYQEVFEADWALAALDSGGAVPSAPRPQGALPIVRVESPGDTLRLWPTMSPVGWIPCEECWDETHLVRLLDGARTDAMVQLLTYRPVSGREYYAAIETALRRAAARGVHVRLLLSDWCKRPNVIPYLKSLSLVPNIEVRLVTIPQWSGGFIPYARVIHAKYLVVDGRRAWIGTSNWERDYFHNTRNVGLALESDRIGSHLTRFFESNWESEYAYPVRPEEAYSPPRIGE